MIFVFIVVAGIMLGIVAAFLLRDQKIPLNALTLSATGLLTLLGIVSGWYGHNGIDRGLAIAGWPVADGVVVDGWIEGNRASHAVVAYEYTVEDKTYRDSAAIESPSFGGRKKRREVAVKTLAEYPNGRLVRVSYHPLAPTQTTIRQSVFWSYYGSSGLGMVLVGLSICLVLLMLLGRRNKSRC